MENRDSISKYSHLMMACEEGDIGKVQVLLPSNHLNEKNSCGHSALSLAVKNGHSNIAELLMNNGADGNAINNSGQSILFIACWNGRED